MPRLLENARLKVTIDEPGELYKGPRFDRTGNITQVILDGKISYCTTERILSFDAGQHGQGLFNEFGINRPVGYDECKVGDKFLKIGAGLLTRTSIQPYDFFASYPLQPFEIIVMQEQDFISYTVMPVNCNGFAVRLEKKITLSGNELIVDYFLENSGIKAIHTNEYCHNFISINHSGIDKDYSLKAGGIIPEFSEMIEAVNPENAITAGRNQLDFNFSPRKDIFFSPFAQFTDKGFWEVTHRKLRAGIREQTDFVPAIMNVWGSTHVLSPELFINIDLEPGSTKTWQRVFKFFTF